MKKKHSTLIEQLSDSELLFHLYATQVLLLIISVLLGLLFFHGFSFLESMKWTDIRILTIGFSAGLIVVFLDFILMKLLPSSFYDDGGLNERIFQNKKLLHIAWIAFIVSLSEELLFRGVLQAKLGLFLASMIFAIIHFRYLFNWFLFLNIILLSFFIGIIFYWTNNLAVTIMMHFTIDFLLGVHLKWKRRNDFNE